MGMVMSLMGMGTPSTQVFNLLIGNLYNQFTEKEIDTFDDFHQAFMDVFATFNSALPGRHYDAPSREQVEDCYYDKWLEADQVKRREIFMEFMKTTVKLSTLDDVALMTGLVTPPAAMAAKKGGENIPQMRIIKAIPDVIFVPTVTIFAIITAKLSRKVLQKKPEPSEPESPESYGPRRPSPQSTYAPRPQSPPSPRPLPTPSIAPPEQRAAPQNSSGLTQRQPLAPSTQTQSSQQTRAPVPPPPPAASSSQNQPTEPATGPSWPWYSPTPQPGFPRTRQPQRQNSSSRRPPRPLFPSST